MKGKKLSVVSDQLSVNSGDAGKKPEEYFFRASAKDFKKIPGSPIAYWVSENVRNIFETIPKIKKLAEVKQGLATADDNRFLRLWHETIINSINRKWIPFTKGGSYRKWAGNLEYVVNWKDDGKEIQNFIDTNGKLKSRPQNQGFYFRGGITWTLISSGKPAFRDVPDGCIFGHKGPMVFPRGGKISKSHACSFFNSCVSRHFLLISSQTLGFEIGHINSLPILAKEISSNQYNILVKLSITDWDSYETSWNFKQLPLLQMDSNGQYSEVSNLQEKTDNCTLITDNLKLISQAYAKLRTHWSSMTLEMQHLEEENNRIFIEAYGLRDELTPEVPLNEITLTCNPHYRYTLSGQWLGASDQEKEAELERRLLEDTMKEFISYAVGCMFGRYSLDAPGLILANQGETLENYVHIVNEKVAGGQKPGVSGQWVVNSDRSEVHGEKLQGSDCLAEGDGSGGSCLPSDQPLSKGGALRPDQPTKTGVGIGSLEYSRGTGAAINSRVQEFSVHSAGIVSGNGNSVADSHSTQLHDSGAIATNNGRVSGNQQDAPISDEQTNHWPLTTNHFLPDADNVIPILGENWFTDDITERFKRFLKTTFGEEHYEENLKFIEDATGKDIRKYFLKNFYTDHVKRYKKRPIYWLFSSPKDSFNALIYMHRYRPDTVSIILNDYLREFRTKLIARREHLEQVSISASATKTEKTRALKEIEKLKKIIEELDTYENEVLYPLATQKIEIDLDDGVKVNYKKFGKALKKVAGLS